VAVENLRVLCLNAGSSSLKYAFLQGEKTLAEGEFGRVDELFDQLPAQPQAVGHRIVFGGPDHTAPAPIDGALIDKLRALSPFAPLHVPLELDLVEEVAQHAPDLPQVACFDTAFHRAMPELAQRFPLPEEFWRQGVRRYGFHGLSYEYICSQVQAERLVIAHLGNGASLAAVKNGKPIDTTMGLTPTGGLMMGTRSGDLDPGLLVYLQRQGVDIEDLVDYRSGLFGVSGLSSDMRELLDSDDPRATLAIDLFCYILKKQIGAMAAALGGLDLLVFTGGIGEHAAPIRKRVCDGFDYLGFSVEVIPTNEDVMIARHVREVLA
jgi:acetate kinase